VCAFGPLQRHSSSSTHTQCGFPKAALFKTIDSLSDLQVPVPFEGSRSTSGLDIPAVRALKGLWVVPTQHPSLRALGLTLVLGCLTLRGPFGLALGFQPYVRSAPLLAQQPLRATTRTATTRTALVLGCLTIRGPFGLALGFNRALVRSLTAALKFVDSPSPSGLQEPVPLRAFGLCSHNNNPSWRPLGPRSCPVA
jgi:hypothetical protein